MEETGYKYGGMIWVNSGGGINRGRHKFDPEGTDTECTQCGWFSMLILSRQRHSEILHRDERCHGRAEGVLLRASGVTLLALVT